MKTKNIKPTKIIILLFFCLCLIGTGCNKNESALTQNPSTNTPLPPTHTDIPTPTAFPLPPTPTSTPEPIPGIRTYGGDLTDWAYDILLLSDGGYLIVGRTNNKGLSHRITTGNAHVFRTDSEGDIIWEKDFATDVDANFYNPIQTGEDEFVILGQIVGSYTRDEEDIYLVKINGDGDEIWSHTYGGRGMDFGCMVLQTFDGGFIIVGSRADEFPTDDLYENNLILIKTDADGNEVWSQTYGEKILYLGWAVVQTPDGGYVLTGWEAKTYDDRDIIMMKTNEAGETEWSRTWDLEPGDWDGCFDMILTSDGHIVASCNRAMLSKRNAVLLKVDQNGNEIYLKEFIDDEVEYSFWDIMEDSDGGYVMSGATIQDRNPVTGEGILNGLIIKTDPEGEVLWKKINISNDFQQTMFSSAVVNPDGGYIFVGMAIPNDKNKPDMLWLNIYPNDHVIAFTSERDGNSEIYTMDAEGTEFRRLTNDPAYDGWPSWSPDGSKIAFMSTRSGNPDIYVMNADGTNLQQLTDHPANDIWPEWSPDGTKIAFPSRRDGNFEIYTINVDGSDLTRLTNTPGHEDFPTWSPDGTQIIFSRTEGDDGTFIINADGSNEQKLADFTALEPAWSPDGSRIAFGSDHEGFRSIYIIDADGSNLRKLSNTLAGENCPTWSPDGAQIAFASWRDGDGEIYIMDVDGSNLIKLTDNKSVDEFPSWRSEFLSSNSTQVVP